MNSAAKILRDELVSTLVLVDDFCLPGQKVSHDVMLKILPFELIAGIQNAIARRQVFPAVHELPPIRKTPDFVDRLRRFVLLFQTL